MKKILYIWKGEYPWDVRVEKICKALIDNAYDVTILCRWGAEEQEYEVIDGINIIRFGKSSSRKSTSPFFINPLWSKKIAKTLFDVKPDLIIVREMLIAELSAKQAKKFSIPILMDMAENYPACMREWKKYNDSTLKRFVIHKFKLPDLIEKRAIQYIDGIITVCDEQVKRLEKQYGFDNRKTVVVHNTPKENKYFDDRNIDLNNIIIGHHGFLTAEKSLLNFITAFAIAKPSNIIFVIAGNGDCQNEYEAIVNKYNAEDRIIFTGSYQYDELPNILQKIDIGVLPYQISDFNNTTIHNKIFDFWLAGKPVIVSEAEPLKRLIAETDAGITIECESVEKIVHFLNDFMLHDWIQMKSKVHQATEIYNWKHDQLNLIEFIKEYLLESK